MSSNFSTWMTGIFLFIGKGWDLCPKCGSTARVDGMIFDIGY
jgi:hypothetical protein